MKSAYLIHYSRVKLEGCQPDRVLDGQRNRQQVTRLLDLIKSNFFALILFWSGQDNAISAWFEKRKTSSKQLNGMGEEKRGTLPSL